MHLHTEGTSAGIFIKSAETSEIGVTKVVQFLCVRQGERETEENDAQKGDT